MTDCPKCGLPPSGNDPHNCRCTGRGHAPEVRALAEAMLHQGYRSPAIRAALEATYGVYVSKWTVNVWAEKLRRLAGPSSIDQQVARLDQWLARERAAEEEWLGRLRRVPPLRTPEQPYHHDAGREG